MSVVSVFFITSKRTVALPGQARMTGLALMHIKYGMELNLDDIINIFAGQHQRRMFFADISRIIYAILHAIFFVNFPRPNCDITST